MAEDTIRREDALQALVESDVRGYEYRQLEDAIKAIPSADITSYEKGYADAVQGIADELVKQGKHIEADRPQGEWIAKTENYHSHWVCSECGSWALLEYNEQMCLSNYCPNCGARLKGASADIDCFDTCEYAYSEVCDECYKGNKYKRR